jgi:hypothetical protein
MRADDEIGRRGGNVWCCGRKQRIEKHGVNGGQRDRRSNPRPNGQSSAHPED